MKDELKVKGLLLAILTIAIIVGTSMAIPSTNAKELIDGYPTATPVGGEILPANQFGIISQWLGLILMASVIVGALVFLAKKPIFKNY